MGILNSTPDSFSDGGEYITANVAIEKAEKMMEEGADIIDIGGESTAPGNNPISHTEEWERIETIVIALLQKNIPLSLDSYKAETWEKFLSLGGRMLNDVSGLQKEQEKKIELLKKYPESKVIIMFSRNPKEETKDIMEEIFLFFESTFTLLEKHQIPRTQIIIDPGMGGFLSVFPCVSFSVLKHLVSLKKFQCPILIGTSRKSFLREVSHHTDPKKRDFASVITSFLAIQNGADIIRIHDVSSFKETMNILNTVQNAS